MASLTRFFNGPCLVNDCDTAPPDIQLARAMEEAGIDPPPMVQIDGRIHRFNPDGKKGNKSGWYIAYPDGITAGAFGDWKTGLHQRWCADIGRELTLNERIARDKRYEEAKRARDEEREKTLAVVSETVAEIWERCAPASPDHPYLKRKGVQPHGARVSGDSRLVLPLYDEEGNLSTLQYISPDGSKLYHSGGATKGRYWLIGTPGKTIYLAEGFATSASIHEATNAAVFIAYTAGNLVNVAGLLREKFGDQQDIVIVADTMRAGQGNARHCGRLAVDTGYHYPM